MMRRSNAARSSRWNSFPPLGRSLFRRRFPDSEEINIAARLIIQLTMYKIRPLAHRLLWILAAIALIIAVLMFTAFARTVGRDIAKAAFEKIWTVALQRRRVFAQNAWSRHTLTDISLDAPLEISVLAGADARIPHEIRGFVDDFEAYQTDGSETFSVGVTRCAYKGEDVAANVDSAIRGAISNVAAMFGDNDPQYDLHERPEPAWMLE